MEKSIGTFMKESLQDFTEYLEIEPSHFWGMQISAVQVAYAALDFVVTFSN